jgi:3-dehydroquinate dehydratase II
VAAVLLLNGPNLNLLGEREPEIYGTTTLVEIETRLIALGRELSVEVRTAQHNGEGELIDAIHEARNWASGIVYNPGAHAHYSYAIADAVSSISIPVIEVHLSNIYAREEHRRRSVIAPVAAGVISGLGLLGYELALRALASRLG